MTVMFVIACLGTVSAGIFAIQAVCFAMMLDQELRRNRAVKPGVARAADE
jgi:hypothetical protein